VIRHLKQWLATLGWQNAPKSESSEQKTSPMLLRNHLIPILEMMPYFPGHPPHFPGLSVLALPFLLLIAFVCRVIKIKAWSNCRGQPRRQRQTALWIAALGQPYVYVMLTKLTEQR